MKAKIVMYIITAAINMYLISWTEAGYGMLIKKWFQPMFYIASSGYYSFIYNVTLFVLSLLAPIMVLYKKHCLVQFKMLLIAYTTIIIISILHSIIFYGDYLGSFNDSFKYILQAIYEVSIKDNIMIVSLLYALVLTGNQWLLTILYQRFNVIKPNNSTS
ncbi:MAG: hypothetical protein MI922_22180 [Bacteroidales bacterium]|nr:hypothetical protein [Bacteroidales bacterium]